MVKEHLRIALQYPVYMLLKVLRLALSVIFM